MSHFHSHTLEILNIINEGLFIKDGKICYKSTDTILKVREFLEENFIEKEIIDLRTCVTGQNLISKHGMILTYVKSTKNKDFPHTVTYPDGSIGTRNNEGKVYNKTSLPEDHDIIMILPEAE